MPAQAMRARNDPKEGRGQEQKERGHVQLGEGSGGEAEGGKGAKQQREGQGGKGSLIGRQRMLGELGKRQSTAERHRKNKEGPVLCLPTHT